MNIRLDSRSNNDWKANAFVFNFPSSACSSFYDNMPDISRIVFGGLTKPTPCVRQGVFKFNDQPVNWTFPNVPVMPYGYWRLRFASGPKKAKQASICVIVEAHTIPQPKRNGG
ncbi:hypothetical protein ONE63_006794 [Megalurothrips usitatus]|uniref:Uncharacterized protein n=1 Tax=Megalurothrips usitatus TaxID=439358 RepID=A0AAV7XU53_9NEOP|nr:hypothetical protein ONE63_006794 [Megalurothrips usitatus]